MDTFEPFGDEEEANNELEFGEEEQKEDTNNQDPPLNIRTNDEGKLDMIFEAEKESPPDSKLITPQPS